MSSDNRTLFYIRDSGGSFTNLQVYAYRRALEEWTEIRDGYSEQGDDFVELRERCVFAIVALGLSLSQLLGQNNPRPRESKVPAPRDLFREIVAELDLDRTLVPRFDELIEFYDAARHFGVTKDDSKYDKIIDLDFETTKQCLETGVEIWCKVITAYRRDPSARLDDFDPSIHPPDGFEQYWPTWSE